MNFFWYEKLTVQHVCMLRNTYISNFSSQGFRYHISNIVSDFRKAFYICYKALPYYMNPFATIRCLWSQFMFLFYLANFQPCMEVTNRSSMRISLRTITWMCALCGTPHTPSTSVLRSPSTRSWKWYVCNILYILSHMQIFIVHQHKQRYLHFEFGRCLRHKSQTKTK